MTYVACPRCGFWRDVRVANAAALLCKHCKSVPATRSLPGDWADDAACAGETHNPELWFPGTGAAGRFDANVAKLICVTECPVTQPCLEWALASGETDGVLGGMTPDERRTEQTRRHTA